MSDGSFEVQAAVFAVLSSLSPVLAAGGVHAPAPQDALLPYVEIGEVDAVAADIQTRAGLEESLAIHVWTNADQAFGQAKLIMSRIREALHARKLTVTGRSAAFATVRSTRVFTDSDGAAVHGVVNLLVNHFGPKEA